MSQTCTVNLHFSLLRNLEKNPHNSQSSHLKTVTEIGFKIFDIEQETGPRDQSYKTFYTLVQIYKVVLKLDNMLFYHVCLWAL